MYLRISQEGGSHLYKVLLPPKKPKKPMGDTGILVGVEYIYYLMCGDGKASVCMSRLIKLYALNVHSSLYVSYTSVKLIRLCLYVEFKKQNKRTKEKRVKNSSTIENKQMVTREQGGWGMGEKVMGIKSTITMISTK